MFKSKKINILIFIFVILWCLYIVFPDIKIYLSIVILSCLILIILKYKKGSKK